MKYKLSQVFELQMGKTPARNNEAYWGGNNKWISIADIGKAPKYISDTKECITDRGVSVSGIKKVPRGTVIMSFKLSIGKTAITSEDMFTNEAIMAFIDKGAYPIDTNYFYHFCHGRDWMAGTNKAVMGLTLNKATLSDVEIDIPEIEQQREIASRLDFLDALISSRREQLAKLDELVKSRFIELFDACNCRISTFGKEFSFISRGKSPSYVELSDLAVINQACIYWNGLNLDKVKYNDVSYSGDRILQFGDVLVNSTGTGTLGRANIFMRRSADKRYMADSHVTIIRGSVSCHPVYIKCYLEQAKIQDAIYRNCVSGSTNQIELSKEKFKELELPVPPMTLQKQFAAFVEQTDKSKLAIQESLAELETLKKALMQKYFG